MGLEDPILIQLISEMHPELDAMQAPSSHSNPDVAGPFLSRLFHLGARLHRDPRLLGHQEVQRLLARGALPDVRVGQSIREYARGLEDLNHEPWELESDWGAFLIDHWARACTERSALEFALELFPGLFSEGARGEIGETLAQSDAHFKAKVESGVQGHPEQIPSGVPLSHWWWRYEGGQGD